MMPSGASYEETILEHVKKAGVQNGYRNERLQFESVEPVSGRILTAVGIRKDAEEGTPARVGIALGPEYGTVDSLFIKNAARESLRFGKIDLLLILGFAFDANATEATNEINEERGEFSVIQERHVGKMTVLNVRMNPDLAMGDELANTGTGNLFTVFGEPDIEVTEADDGQLVAEIKGLDIYNPTTGDVRAEGPDDIMMCLSTRTTTPKPLSCATSTSRERTGSPQDLTRTSGSARHSRDRSTRRRWPPSSPRGRVPSPSPSQAESRSRLSTTTATRSSRPSRSEAANGRGGWGGCRHSTHPPVRDWSCHHTKVAGHHAITSKFRGGLMNFTDAQRTAINTHDDNLLIVACAGSGKTEVISQRIAGLIGRPDMQPKNIVAFTFTEKAAGELKERVHTRIRELHGEVHGLAEMYIGTMHGYALDLLHSHVPEAFKYNVLNDVQTRLIIDKYSKQSGLTTTNAIVNGSAKPLRRWVNSKLYQQVMSILREDEVDHDGLRADVSEGLEKYMTLLRDRSYFDYTAILHYAAVLLNDDNGEGDESVLNLQRHIKETVKYVVVDEYQDTNPVQEQVIHGLTRHGANLCVVGDDDQTIYSGVAVPSRTFSRSRTATRTFTASLLTRTSAPVPPSSTSRAASSSIFRPASVLTRL